MTHRLPVKDHLRNGNLYHPQAGGAPGPEWKLRLFRQYAAQRQLKALLRERTSPLRWTVYAGTAGGCVALALAAYFGFIHPGDWMKSGVPAIGMREALVLIAVVNGWVFITKRRVFSEP
jgi:hypothetical protein